MSEGSLAPPLFFPRTSTRTTLTGCSQQSSIKTISLFISLTFQSNGFITMLAQLRDYFYPNGLNLPLFLHTTERCYFSRLSVGTGPNETGFKKTQSITSEDVNVEHLLDFFPCADSESKDVWDACAGLVRHLSWHKQRPTVLGANIEGL